MLICWNVIAALSLGDTTTLIASRDELVTVRCAAGDGHQLRWMKLRHAPAAHHGSGGAGWVQVSTRRRLMLNAGVDGRDGVYLCIVTERTGPSSAAAAVTRLAANVTVISPCEYPLAREFLIGKEHVAFSNIFRRATV